MAMSRVDEVESAGGSEIVQHVSTGSMSAIARSEVESQIDCAHKYKRSITKFLMDARTMATITPEVAESCMYSVPRDGKTITGPSVRLAEICASAYGNLQIAARVLEAEDTEIVAQGAAWDMERNTRFTIEVRRRITGKNNRRFSSDMIAITGNAAASIALRNAIFRVIPRAYVDTIYDHARSVAVGDAKTLVDRRTTVLERLLKMGITRERVLARLDKPGVDDIGLAELEALIGFGTSIKNGDLSADEAFPPLVAVAGGAAPGGAPAPAAPSEDGKRISMKGKKADAPPAVTPDPVTGELPLDAGAATTPAKEDPPLTDAEAMRREVAEADAADSNAAANPDNDGR